MFILKTDMYPCDAADLAKKIHNMTGKEGIILPLNDELLWEAPISTLKELRDKLDSKISVLQCCEYDVERKNLKK